MIEFTVISVKPGVQNLIFIGENRIPALGMTKTGGFRLFAAQSNRFGQN
jgi:hypothetical protein